MSRRFNQPFPPILPALLVLFALAILPARLGVAQPGDELPALPEDHPLAGVEPLAAATYIPSTAEQEFQVPLLIWCSATGQTLGEAAQRADAIALDRGWLALTIRPPYPLAGRAGDGADRRFGWRPQRTSNDPQDEIDEPEDPMEHRVLRTIHAAMLHPVFGQRIDRSRVILAGERQGGTIAMSTALVEPSRFNALWLIHTRLLPDDLPADRLRGLGEAGCGIYALHTDQDALGRRDTRRAMARIAEWVPAAAFEELASVADLAGELDTTGIRFALWFRGRHPDAMFAVEPPDRQDARTEASAPEPEGGGAEDADDDSDPPQDNAE